MHQIRYFVATADCLNFTRAAERCGVSQPALTRAIHKLEEELGGPLFRREGRRTHLTELGRIVQPRLKQALSLTEIVRSEALDFSKMVDAKLELGVMCTIAPASLISLVDFMSKHAPQLSLVLRDGSGAALTSRLIDGELDVALFALPEMPDELHAIPLFEEPYVVACPKGHRFEQFDEVPTDALSGERYLRRLNCEYLDHLEEVGFADTIQVDPRFQSEHESWVQAMVIAGLGCAIMPESLALSPEFKCRPLTDPGIRRTISVVTRRGRQHTAAVEFFVMLCRRMDWGARAVSTERRPT
ncbi:MAG: LysR family transcriptional regulator [Pseudomonadota bacterium]